MYKKRINSFLEYLPVPSAMFRAIEVDEDSNCSMSLECFRSVLMVSLALITLVENSTAFFQTCNFSKLNSIQSIMMKCFPPSLITNNDPHFSHLIILYFTMNCEL